MKSNNIRSLRVEGNTELAMENYAKAKVEALNILLFADSFILLSVCSKSQGKNIKLGYVTVNTAFLNINPKILIKELRDTADQLEKTIHIDQEKS